MTARAHSGLRHWLTSSGPLRVPEITVFFWVIKGLSTAFGEATSDYSVHAIAPQAAVVLGFLAFLFSLAVQFRRGHYEAWSYWFAVVMVGVFGTMAADVLHVGLGVPYVASTILYAVVLASVFMAWHLTEKTLSIHSVTTPRREMFYWGAVVATFAMGTALGDLTAVTFGLGYFPSAALFAGLIAIPALGYRFFRWNAIASFWIAYVLTRPLGASLADGIGKPKTASGLGLGDGEVAAVLAVIIVLLVGYLVLTKADVGKKPALESDPARRTGRSSDQS